MLLPKIVNTSAVRIKCDFYAPLICMLENHDFPKLPLTWKELELRVNVVTPQLQISLEHSKEINQMDFYSGCSMALAQVS